MCNFVTAVLALALALPAVGSRPDVPASKRETSALPATLGQPQISAKKREAIRTVLELTGTIAVANEEVDRMFDAFSKTLPAIPASVWQRLKQRTHPEELVERMIPVYDKYYTQQDLDGIIAFYRSPLGKKFIETTPDVARDGFGVGQEWATEQGEAILKELRSEGLLHNGQPSR